MSSGLSLSFCVFFLGCLFAFSALAFSSKHLLKWLRFSVSINSSLIKSVEMFSLDARMISRDVLKAKSTCFAAYFNIQIVFVFTACGNTAIICSIYVNSQTERILLVSSRSECKLVLKNDANNLN